MTDWVIERLVCGDGSTDVSGCTLTPGVIYASEKRRGLFKTFWAVNSESLHIWPRSDPENDLKARLSMTNRSTAAASTSATSTLVSLTEGTCSVVTDQFRGEDDSGKVSDSKERAVRAGENMVHWLRANPGVIRDIGGPGFRQPVAELKTWKSLDFGPVIWGSDPGMCGAATIVHAVGAVRSRTVALAYYAKLRSMRPNIGNLAGMTEVVRQMRLHVPSHLYAKVEFRQLNKLERAAFDLHPYNWLSKQRRCFALRFWQTGVVDHIVCVDGRRGIIWDSEETHPILLNPDSLRLCCGIKASKVRFQVMSLAKQRDAKPPTDSIPVIVID